MRHGESRRTGKTPLPHLTVRIDLDEDGRIGPGKIELPECVNRYGSISAAGRAMNMSYKHAWDLIDEMQRTFGRPLVRGQSGGLHGGGTELTPLGYLLIERYRRIADAAFRAAQADLMILLAEVHKRHKDEMPQ